MSLGILNFDDVSTHFYCCYPHKGRSHLLTVSADDMYEVFLIGHSEMLGCLFLLLTCVNCESCGTGVPVVDYHGARYCWNTFIPLVFPTRTQYCTVLYGNEKKCADVPFASVYQMPDLLDMKWTGPVFSRDILVATMGTIATTLVLITSAMEFWQRCKCPEDRIDIVLV